MIEKVVSLPIYNPDHDRRRGVSRTFVFMGKLDRMEIQDGTLVDWKCTSDPMKFIREKTISFQAELYAAALKTEGYDVQEIIYKLLSIPTITFCGKDKTQSDYEERCVSWLQERAERLMEHPVPINPYRIFRAQEWMWDLSKRIEFNLL